MPQSRRRPLPEALQSAPFTLAGAHRCGVDARRLTYDDVVQLGGGVHASAELVERTPPERRHHLIARALAAEMPQVWISDSTAAQMRGLVLPRRLAAERRVHLSQPPSPGTRIQRNGVVGHRRAVRQKDVVTREGAAISSAARNWLELAEACTHRDLVILGDQLVRRPYPESEQRTEPWATLEELAEVVTATRRVRGRRTALAALADIRVGADSPAETLLRLAIVDAGLPEPQLQVPAIPTSPLSPAADLGYPEWKIALQYEGATHYSPEQHRRDQERDNVFRAHGWEILHFHREHWRTQFRTAAAIVGQLLRTRGLIG